MSLLATGTEVHANGRRVRVARMGRGQAVVLLHGYPDNLQIWSELAPRLADSFFAVIAFDWPGMGYSDSWTGGANPLNMADRLLALLDAWEIERATLVGHDMGGQPALALAARHPERVSGLVVMNSLVIPDEQTSWEIGLMRRFIVRLCAGYQGVLPRLPALYGQIACPTLVLWGERDGHFPPAHAQRLHAAIPGSRLEIVPDGRHWLAWYRAELVANAVQALCRR